jgi:DNA replication licensing factor MCM2
MSGSFLHTNPQVAALYADLRAQSAISGGVPIAVRHIESIIRMAEATARMSLRVYVRDDDIDFAIKVTALLHYFS